MYHRQSVNLPLRALLFATLFLAANICVIGQQTANDYFETGLRLLRQGKPQEALEAFQANEKLDPGNSATAANIGSIFMILRKPADAVTAFRRAVKLKETNASYHFALCQALASTNDLTAAIVSCTEAARLEPTSEEYAAFLININSHAKTPQVESLIEVRIQNFPNSVAVIEAAAVHYYGAGDWARSAELFERLTQLVPQRASYIGAVGILYLRLGREADAITAARRAIEIEPESKPGNYCMGRIFLEVGLMIEARNAFSKAAGDEFPDAEYLLGITEKRLGQFAAAVGPLERAAKRDPNNYDYQNEYADVLNELKRTDESLPYYRRALSLRPREVYAMVALSQALIEVGQFEEALSVLDRADQLKPGVETIAMFKRIALSLQRDIPRIPDMMEEAKDHPDDVGIRITLVELLSRIGKLKETDTYASQIQDLAPKDPKVYVRIGISYSVLRQDEKVLQMYKKALEVDPESPDAYSCLAGFYYRKGMIAESFAAYDKLFNLRPDAPGVMHIYAVLLSDQGKRREALAMFKRSLGISPANGPAVFRAAVLSAQLGELDAAQQYLAIEQSLDPPSARQLSRILKLKLYLF